MTIETWLTYVAAVLLLMSTLDGAARAWLDRLAGAFLIAAGVLLGSRTASR